MNGGGGGGGRGLIFLIFFYAVSIVCRLCIHWGERAGMVGAVAVL